MSVTTAPEHFHHKNNGISEADVTKKERECDAVGTVGAFILRVETLYSTRHGCASEEETKTVMPSERRVWHLKTVPDDDIM